MNFLDHFSSPEALTPRSYTSGKGGAHIFVELITRFHDKLSVSETMDLYYLHSMCEKSLNYWRSRDFNSAKITYKQVCAINRDQFSPLIRDGVETIFLACDAYHDYINKRYGIAVEKIEKAMGHSLKQKEQMPDFVKSIYEHSLNLLRIYIRTKDIDRVVYYFSALLNSLFYDIREDFLAPELLDLDEEQRENWLHYIINNVIFSIQRTFKEEESNGAIIFKETFSRVLPNASAAAKSYNIATQIGLQAVHAFMQHDDGQYVSLLNDQFEAIKESPNFVKKLILSNHIYWAEMRGENLSSHKNYKNFSQIAAIFGVDVNSSPILREAV